MDVKTLSAMLGHVSAATTLDIYAHVTGDMQRRRRPKSTVDWAMRCGRNPLRKIRVRPQTSSRC